MENYTAFSRLNKLVAKGYVVRWDQSDETTLRLEHPSGSARYLLILYSDGSVWVVHPERLDQPDDYLKPDDVLRFDSLVDSVPKSTGLQSLKAMTVEDAWGRVKLEAWYTLFYALLGLGVGVAIWFLIKDRVPY